LQSPVGIHTVRYPSTFIKKLDIHFVASAAASLPLRGGALPQIPLALGFSIGAAGSKIQSDCASRSAHPAERPRYRHDDKQVACQHPPKSGKKMQLSTRPQRVPE
jgi:hypothetical protein